MVEKMGNELLVVGGVKLPANIEVSPEWLKTRDGIMEKAAAVKAVASQADYTNAEIVLKLCVSVSNEAEKRRKDLTTPFNTLTKRIKAMADEAREPLETEKERLKSLLGKYIVEQERLRREAEEAAAMAALEMERKRAEAEAAAAESDDAFAEPEYPDTEVDMGDLVPFPDEPIKSMTSTYVHWCFEVEDETQVPRGFLSVDERKIREYVNRDKDAANIPGVKIWSETRVKTR